jgi:hypothetical protein
MSMILVFDYKYLDGLERVGFFGENLVLENFDEHLYAHPIWIIYIGREDIGNGGMQGWLLLISIVKV